MALTVTKAHAKQAIERYDSLKRRIAGMRENAEKTTKTVVRTAEVGGAAFGMSFVQTRFIDASGQPPQVFGVPLDLGIGIALGGFGLLGGAGAYSEHLTNVSDGCIAAYASAMGRGLGATTRGKALGSGAKVKGVRLTSEEVADMAGLSR